LFCKDWEGNRIGGGVLLYNNNDLRPREKIGYFLGESIWANIILKTGKVWYSLDVIEVLLVY